MEAVPSKKKSTSQNGFTLWHGMNFSTLLDFLKLKPAIHYSKYPRLASLFLICASNSFWSMIERMRHGKGVENTQLANPIFILGHWRSGTTLLHNLMTLDDRFCFPNMYQCLFPTHFLTTEKTLTYCTEWLLPDTRPMDNMEAGWDIPQEDEFAIINLSLISCYMLLAWQNGDRSSFERFVTMKDATPAERKKWKETIVYFMKKITYLYKNKPVILKSPGHTPKVEILLELFPNAKFVYIYRNPYRCVTSSIHLREVLYPLNDFGKTNYDYIERDALDLYVETITTYEKDKALIPEGNLFEVRYEDFEQDPEIYIEQIYKQLNLGDSTQVMQKLEPMLPKLKGYKKNKFQMDPARKRFLYEKLKFAFDIYGYDPDLDPNIENQDISSPLETT